MSKELGEIRKIIKEELSKRHVLLEEPEPTMAARLQKRPISATEPTKIVKQQEPVSRDEPETSGEKKGADLAPGFNLFYGILSQSFIEAQTMNGETGKLIQKMTKMALEEIGADEETSGVFQSSSQVDPKDMLKIVQKAMLVALNHVAELASAESIERDMYPAATGE